MIVTGFGESCNLVRESKTYRNADCCVNTVDESYYTVRNLVNFDQGTLSCQPILWRETATCWNTPPLLFVLAFYNGWEYRNADYNIVYDSSTSAKNFLNFFPITLEILLSICVGGLLGWCTVHIWPKYARFPCFNQSALD